MSIFGPVIDGHVVENNVKLHLQNWLPTYLAQLAEDRGLDRGAIALPKLWLNTTEFTTDWTATNTPAILIITSGIDGRPQMEGDGSYRVAWVVGIGALVSAGGDNARQNSNILARRYGAAIRWAMLQYASLGSEDVVDTDWEDEAYDDIPSDDLSGLASVRLVFRIEYRNVLNANMGPGQPDPVPDLYPDPYPDWGVIPDIDHIGVTITKEEIE